jgi:hypothetical protein
LTYVVGFETGPGWNPIGGQYPAAAWGAKADIGTPSLPITLHPATIKIVVGGRYATIADQKQHRAGWIMRIGETKPRHYIEGYNPDGNWWNIFPMVSGGTSYIDWGVQTPARVEYYHDGIYKTLLANTWWASSWTSYPSYRLPIPHYVVGLASGTGNDLNGIVRNAMRKSEEASWWEFRDWDYDVTMDPQKYYYYMVSTGYYRDDFNIHSVY